MSLHSHTFRTAQRPHSEGSEEYAARSLGTEVPAVRTFADMLYGLQPTMGNQFVSRVARSDFAAANSAPLPSGVPAAPMVAAPEGDEEWAPEGREANQNEGSMDTNAGTGDTGGAAGGGESGGAQESGGGAGATTGQGGGAAASGLGAGTASGGQVEGEASATTRDVEGASREEVEAEAGVETETETYKGAGDGPPVVGPAATGTAGAGMSSRFVDGGRVGTIPLVSTYLRHLDDNPHAFVDGGRTGDTQWAGGGGAGPKGNQASGSIQSMVVPDYSSRGNLWDNADAYVEPGTGTLDVIRSYVSSNMGDQGNGWYVTAGAASALEAHERKHVDTARTNYDTYLGPMLARVADSNNLGRGKTFWRSDAKALLKQQIGWERSLKSFEENDKMDNGKGGAVDQADQSGPGWPRNLGTGELAGVKYENRLILNSEKDPAIVGLPN